MGCDLCFYDEVGVERNPVSLSDVEEMINTGKNYLEKVGIDVHSLFSGEYSHKVERKPVTKENVAVLVANNHTDMFGCNMGDVFHEIIFKLIRKNASSFVVSVGDLEQLGDLEQDCFMRVWDKLDKFNPKYALSTWVTTVCVNLLRGKCKKFKRYRNNVVQEEELMNNIGKESEPVELRRQMQGVLLSLFSYYEEEKDQKMLRALFGNPSDRNYCLPDRICISSLSRKHNISYVPMLNFYRKKVTPFFKNYFK